MHDLRIVFMVFKGKKNLGHIYPLISNKRSAKAFKPGLHIFLSIIVHHFPCNRTPIARGPTLRIGILDYTLPVAVLLLPL